MRRYNHFREFLIRKGTTSKEIERYIKALELYDKFTIIHKDAKKLDNVIADDIDIFVNWLKKEKNPISAPRRAFWAYGRFTDNWTMELEALVSIGRSKSPLRLAKLKILSKKQISQLESVGIKNTDHLIKELKTKISD